MYEATASAVRRDLVLHRAFRARNYGFKTSPPQGEVRRPTIVGVAEASNPRKARASGKMPLPAGINKSDSTVVFYSVCDEHA
jgi:hypothetical protein